MAERRNRAYAPRMAPEDRREQLLDAVLRVIVEQGVHKVSIDTVAREAGVSRPVIYGLFDDSEDLLRASLDREETAALAQLGESMPSAATRDPARALSESLEKFLAAVQAAPDRWRAVFTLVDSSTPAFRRRLESGRRAFIAALETFVRETARAERRQSVDIEMTARIIYALVWDAGRLLLAAPETFSAQRICEFNEAMFRAIPAFQGGQVQP